MGLVRLNWRQFESVVFKPAAYSPSSALCHPGLESRLRALGSHPSFLGAPGSAGGCDTSH